MCALTETVLYNTCSFSKLNPKFLRPLTLKVEIDLSELRCSIVSKHQNAFGAHFEISWDISSKPEIITPFLPHAVGLSTYHCVICIVNICLHGVHPVRIVFPY